MATEQRRPTSYTGTGLTNGANAYDSNLTTTAAHNSGTAVSITRTATTSTFAAGSTSYASMTLTIKWSATTGGDGAVTQWDSTASILYSVDAGVTWQSTGLSRTYLSGESGRAFGGDGSGTYYLDGPFTDTIALSVTDPTLVMVKTVVVAKAATGTAPNVIAGAYGLLNLYECYVTGTLQTISIGPIVVAGSYTRVYRTHTLSLSASVTSGNVNWTCANGSFNPTTTTSGATTIWTAGEKGNPTLTATSAADGTKTATQVIEIVNTGKKSSGNF